MIGTFAFFYLNPSFDHLWLFGSASYAKMESVIEHGFLAKIICIYGRSPDDVQPINTYSEKTILVYEMGKYTLYVYLLHGFVIKTFRASPLEQWIGDYQLIWLLVPATLILVYILSSPSRAMEQRDGSLVNQKEPTDGNRPPLS